MSLPIKLTYTNMTRVLPAGNTHTLASLCARATTLFDIVGGYVVTGFTYKDEHASDVSLLTEEEFGPVYAAHLEKNVTLTADKTLLKKKSLRAILVNNECHVDKTTAWALKTPYEVRDAAMVDMVNAYASNFAKQKKNANHTFSLKFRSRKDHHESIVVLNRTFKNGVFHPTFFGKTPLRSAEPLPAKLEYDSRLVRNRLGHYHLCIPQPLAIKSDNQAQRVQGRVAALDPGVRTFQTIYDSTGYVIEAGRNDFGRIHRLCFHLDQLESRIASSTSERQKWRMRKAAMRLHLRIRNLVDECHKKLVNFLVSEYEVILLPSFETSNMVQHGKRVLSSKSVRAMLTWSHYRFKQRLLFKRAEYPWCKVLVVDEAYTSKTCGNCGQLHHSLGASKVFHCPACNVTMDRDANAARNILLKNSRLFGFVAEETLGLTPSLLDGKQRAECMVDMI